MDPAIVLAKCSEGWEAQDLNGVYHVRPSYREAEIACQEANKKIRMQRAADAAKKPDPVIGGVPLPTPKPLSFEQQAMKDLAGLI